ncbi:hypothetical protein GOV10_01805 [Candidatus Woesearchaeota archaeon]|nr:hypothetical protein [Candidatus Woesearchaeota archaeon]
MTFTIEGTLLVQEKPEKYLNKFVEFNNIEVLDGDTTHRRHSYITTPHERVANFLNKRGRNFQWNEDLETALASCQSGEIKIDETKILTPIGCWEMYLSTHFGNTDEYQAIEGTLKVWKETRIPTPWLYVFASATLEGVFECESGVFLKPMDKDFEGKRTTKGILFETPMLKLYRYSRNWEESSKTFRHF